MSGSAGAQNLTGVVPGAQSRQDLADSVSPRMGRQLAMNAPVNGGNAMPGSPEPSPQELHQAMSGGETPQAPGAPSAPADQAQEATPQELLAAMQGAGEGAPDASGQAPATDPNAAAQPPADVSIMDKMLARVGTNPKAQAEILKHLSGSDLKTRVTDDKAEYQLPGTKEWLPVKPDWFSSTRDFMTNVGGLLPGAAELGTQVLGAAAGTLAGASAGAVQGTPGGLVGMGLGAAAGAIPGEIAGNAAAAVGALHARQSLSELLGASPEKISMMDNVYAAGGGAAGSVAALALRKPAAALAELLKDTVKSGKTSLGTTVSGLHKELEAIYGDLTGKNAPNLKDMGQIASSALEGIEARYGENVGAARRMAAEISGDTKHVPLEYKAAVQKILEKDYNTSMVPKVYPGEPTKWQITPKASIRGQTGLQLPGLVEDMNKIINDEGFTMAELSAKLGDVKAAANHTSSAPTQVENLYRSLYHSLSADENAVMSRVVEGTPAADFVNSAKGTYASSIDELRKLHMGVHQAPEAFAEALTKNSLNAQRAKELLTNPLNQLETGGPTDGMLAWDAIKSSWLGRHFDAARGDSGTGAGLIDIPKLFANMSKKDGAVAEVMLGKGWESQLGGLANAMAKTNWEQLAKNPDTLPHQGLIRSIAKFFGTGFSPIYAAHVLSDLSGMYHGASNNQILKLIQTKGIGAFAQEAKTIQERSMQMKASNMITKIMNATTMDIGPQGMRIKMPIETSMIPVLLNGGHSAPNTPPEQAMQNQTDAFQTYRTHQSERFAALQQQLDAAKAEGAQNATQGLPKFISTHRIRSK